MGYARTPVRRGPTQDALFDGALRLFQPAEGYRVNVDALLLAAFAAKGPVARLAVDLGSGVGAVGLALLHVGAARNVALVEREPELVELARRNLEPFAATGNVHSLDLVREKLPTALRDAAELVVCNPPFFPEGSVRRQRHPLKERARSGEVAPFVEAAACALRGSRGRAAFVYPARALTELFSAAARAKLVPKRLCLVHARADEPARLALVELRRAKPGGLVVEPPLVEWLGPRVRSPALDAIVAGRFGARSP